MTIFFRVPCTHLLNYNFQHTKWHREIQENGGHQQEGSWSWYRGEALPDGSAEEFDENCSTRLRDLADTSLCIEEDQSFAYADVNIDSISTHLRIRWETSKTVPFGTEVPYLGFHWDLCTCIVHPA